MDLNDYGLWIHWYKFSTKIKVSLSSKDRLKSIPLNKDIFLNKEDNFLIEMSYNSSVKIFCHKYQSQVLIYLDKQTLFLDLQKRQYQNKTLLQIILEMIWRHNKEKIKQCTNTNLVKEIENFNIKISDFLDSIPEIAVES